jgi:hypothetical protein
VSTWAARLLVAQVEERMNQFIARNGTDWPDAGRRAIDGIDAAIKLLGNTRAALERDLAQAAEDRNGGRPLESTAARPDTATTPN